MINFNRVKTTKNTVNFLRSRCEKDCCECAVNSLCSTLSTIYYIEEDLYRDEPLSELRATVIIDKTKTTFDNAIVINGIITTKETVELAREECTGDCNDCPVLYTCNALFGELDINCNKVKQLVEDAPLSDGKEEMHTIIRSVK